jgi:hypothetical protein
MAAAALEAAIHQLLQQSVQEGLLDDQFLQLIQLQVCNLSVSSSLGALAGLQYPPIQPPALPAWRAPTPGHRMCASHPAPRLPHAAEPNIS